MAKLKRGKHPLHAHRCSGNNRDRFIKRREARPQSSVSSGGRDRASKRPIASSAKKSPST